MKTLTTLALFIAAMAMTQVGFAAETKASDGKTTATAQAVKESPAVPAVSGDGTFNATVNGTFTFKASSVPAPAPEKKAAPAPKRRSHRPSFDGYKPGQIGGWSKDELDQHIDKRVKEALPTTPSVVVNNNQRGLAPAEEANLNADTALKTEQAQALRLANTGDYTFRDLIGVALTAASANWKNGLRTMDDIAHTCTMTPNQQVAFNSIYRTMEDGRPHWYQIGRGMTKTALQSCLFILGGAVDAADDVVANSGHLATFASGSGVLLGGIAAVDDKFADHTTVNVKQKQQQQQCQTGFEPTW